MPAFNCSFKVACTTGLFTVSGWGSLSVPKCRATFFLAVHWLILVQLQCINIMHCWVSPPGCSVSSAVVGCKIVQCTICSDMHCWVHNRIPLVDQCKTKSTRSACSASNAAGGMHCWGALLGAQQNTTCCAVHTRRYALLGGSSF